MKAIKINSNHKVIIFFAVLFIVLPLSFYAVFRTSAVQTFITGKAASYLSKKLNTEISIGAVDITFFLDIVLKDIKVNDLHNNEMLKIDKLLVDIHRISFARNAIAFKKIKLSNAVFALKKYEGEDVLNLNFIIDYFSVEKDDEEKDEWELKVLNVVLDNVRFMYQDQNAEPSEKGINFNDLDLQEVYADIHNISMLNDTVSALIKSLSCYDKSGFQLENLSGAVKLSSRFLDIAQLNIKTLQSDVKLDLRFDYEAYSAYSDFLEAVNLTTGFNKTYLNLQDVAYFAPALFGMNNTFFIDGDFRGPIANLRGRNVSLKFAENTYYKGDFHVSGLPDVNNTFINFSSKMFATTIADVNSFALPGDTSPVFLKLPENLMHLGYVRFVGNFTGFVEDFVADGVFQTDLGMVKSDLLLRRDPNGLFSYKGTLAATAFNIGKILSVEQTLGNISFDFRLNGKGFDVDNADVIFDGKIHSIYFNNYAYRNINLSGDFTNKKFSGLLVIDDENVDLVFQGGINFMPQKPIFDFLAKVNHIQFDKLNLSSSDVPRSLSANLKCRFNGMNIEDIAGVFIIDDIVYQENDKIFKLDELQIANAALDNKYKNIAINSAFFDAFIEGHFVYAELPIALSNYLENFLPSYFNKTTSEKVEDLTTRFAYNIEISDVTPLADFFFPSISISQDFYSVGSFDYAKDELLIEASAQYVYVNDMYLHNWTFNIKPENELLKISTAANHFYLNESMAIDDLKFSSETKEDSILFDLKWFNKSKFVRNSGDVKGYLSFEKNPEIELKFLRGRFYINDSLWVLTPNNQILFDSTAIAINNFLLRHNSQHIMIDGTLSSDPDNQLDIGFNQFDISDFNALLKDQGLSFGGILSGRVSLYDVYKSFGFVSDIVINDFVFNEDKLGNLYLKSNWDRANNRINLDSEIIFVGSVGENKPFTASGFYYPNAKENAFDITANLENFRLKLLEKYVSSFSSDFRGLASGTLNLKGMPAQPDLSGKLHLRRAGIKIDYLNTIYTFSDEITITHNAIEFDSIVLYDVHGGRAILDGKINHSYFKDFSLNLNFNMQNLMCLNTNASHNDLFYGTAFASGSTRIHGGLESITMDILAKTERNTRFFLPLEGAGEVSENKFVYFISHDTLLVDDSRTDVAGFDMALNFELEVTPDAEMQIIFDSQIGDIIRARGAGNLKMEISMLGDFRMFGNYVIDDGDYLFTLQNIINKRFRIDKGSQISWSGDPFMANADIKAVYQLRAPLFDLLVSSADTSQEHRKRVPVNCLLGMSGNLFNPDISFDIDLPASDENTKNMMRTIINSEAEMNRQIFALLALNRFLPPAGLNEFSNIGVATGLEATSSEMLSNQLSNWLSQISSDFDVGVNYRAGDEMSSDELEVALSTQLFNERVIIDGSVGTTATSQNTSHIVGDVNVEVKLTEDGKFRLKFFNKSNTFDMIKNTAPYTQGVGFFYRKEFDNFNELFNKRN